MIGLRGPLARVVGKALEGDPVDRYPSMTAFLADLTRVRDGLVPEARAGWRRTLARAWRRPATRWAAAAAGVGALGLLVPIVGLVRAEIAAYDRERAAAERAASMEVAVARALASGDTSSADAAFEAFVTYPLHHGTRAEPEAWIAQARRLDGRAAAARPAADRGPRGASFWRGPPGRRRGDGKPRRGATSRRRCRPRVRQSCGSGRRGRRSWLQKRACGRRIRPGRGRGGVAPAA